MSLIFWNKIWVSKKNKVLDDLFITVNFFYINTYLERKRYYIKRKKAITCKEFILFNSLAKEIEKGVLLSKHWLRASFKFVV
jgi:hypothetical protein